MFKATTILVAMVLTASVAMAGGYIAPPANYLPLSEGNSWTYSLPTGGEMTQRVTGFAEVNGVRCASLETRFGQTVMVEYVTSDGEGVQAHKITMGGQEMVYPQPQVRVRLPFQAGDTWTGQAEMNGMKLSVTNQSVGRETIRTPAGTFECIKIKSTMKAQGQSGQMISFSYLADGVGLVQTIVDNGTQRVTIQLTKTNVGRQAADTGANNTATDAACPACGKAMPTGAKLCVTCAARLESAQSQVRPTTCPQCKARVGTDARFCTECGAKINTAISAPAPTPSPTPAPQPQPNTTGQEGQAGDDLDSIDPKALSDAELARKIDQLQNRNAYRVVSGAKDSDSDPLVDKIAELIVEKNLREMRAISERYYKGQSR